MHTTVEQLRSDIELFRQGITNPEFWDRAQIERTLTVTGLAKSYCACDFDSLPLKDKEKIKQELYALYLQALQEYSKEAHNHTPAYPMRGERH